MPTLMTAHTMPTATTISISTARMTTTSRGTSLLQHLSPLARAPRVASSSAGIVSLPLRCTALAAHILTSIPADEDQCLLLFCDYICTQEGTPMPWDKIAAAMEPRDAANGKLPMTGEAVKQHLAKLRAFREDKGRRVPPKLDRNARRSAATAGRTANVAPQTPAQTPSRGARTAVGTGGGATARSKNQTDVVNTPANGSTLLAGVSKSKQRKEQQVLKARKAQDTAQNASARAGGAKVAGAKRGRKQAEIQESDYESQATQEAVRSWQFRPAEPKNYDETTTADFEDIGIKDEEVSDDEPLTSKKKAKIRREQATAPTVASQSGATKPGLLRDTIDLWANRRNNVGDNFSSPENQRQVVNAPHLGQNLNGAYRAPPNSHVPNPTQTQAHAPALDSGMQYHTGPIYQNMRLPIPTPMISESDHQFMSSPTYDSSSPSFPGPGFGNMSGNLHPTNSTNTSLSSSMHSSADDPFFVIPHNVHGGGIGGLPVSPLPSNGGGGSSSSSQPLYPNMNGFPIRADYFNHPHNNINNNGQVPSTPVERSDSFVTGPSDALPQMGAAEEEASSSFASSKSSGSSVNPTGQGVDHMFKASEPSSGLPIDDFFNESMFDEDWLD